MRNYMLVVVAIIGVVLGVFSVKSWVFKNKKLDLLHEIESLDSEGGFPTSEAAMSITNKLHLLFTLTPSDINKWLSEKGNNGEEYDIYPLLALNVVLSEKPSVRSLIKENFSKINHPQLATCWAILLIRENSGTPETIAHIKAIMNSPKLSEEMSEIFGSDWDSVTNSIIYSNN